MGATMSESRRDVFKLSVVSALGLSACAGIAQEPKSVGPLSAEPVPHDVSSQGDIFLRGKPGGAGPECWVLLQWDGSNYIAYSTNHVFRDSEGHETKPDVVTATSSATAAIWALVHADKIVLDDGPDEIPVRNSVVGLNCLRNLLGGSQCAMMQTSWNEINKRPN
jgi:hypothetical protein